ncbi:G-type lectin S-receptor-like serine/threonine-protein kinase SD3-1 [Vigna radiata var. radiata]|uniref:Receptor-like serine/threonine-protein kinase n=1 Tax=Vigna radiata var. radiata TaxID=3916 RepID=A0A1S3UY68_VIGRR|nr:G-type lectin S-receptor-like serine/threonine-protein kinase SD3-1 [Vigna radiata var. radiata]
MLGQGNCHLRSSFLLCMLIGLLMHSVVGAEIPLGSKLSVVDNDYWVSSNGDFAIGFFNISDQPNQFSVGIRFNSKSIPYSRRTVVWVAGGDVTVGNESYFELTQEGELVLFDSLHEAFVWTSGTGNRSVASASLLDNGNLVLMDKEQHIIWESFRTPSDTLLPGQSLFANEKLRAASAIKNSKSSYYSLHMNASGHLELHWESDVIYWTSENPSSASNLSAFLTTSGALELRDRRSKAVWSAFGQDHNDSVNYRYLRLDVDGNLRLYSWVESLGLWRSVWQAVENQCKVFATCGELGVCVFNASGSAECKCPFQVTAGNNKCLVPFERDCASGTNMIAYKNTYLYAFYPPDNSVITSNLQHCEELCLNDPHCTAATFSNDRTPLCSIKKTGYVTGYSDPSVSSISFAKRCSGPIAVNPSFTKSPPSEPPPPLCVPCLMGAATGTFFIIVILQLGIVFIFKRKNSTRQKATSGFTGTNSKGLIVLSFSEIKTLTGDFKNQIGPKVFKGLLPNNLPIALKDLNATLEERKFRSAVMKMGCIHHKNLVKLEGYCCEFDHRFLVYEYCKKGSLDKYIDDPALCKMLTWRKRVEICSNVAKAICYLHSGCREFISHGNLKCENVMLDENLVAKVSEFGFAIADGKATYCGFSAEKDIEDFGKVVLALLTGCRDHEHVELCGWAYKEWMEERVVNVIDRRMEGGYNSEELERVLRIAFWCLQMDERRRPSMGEVVRVIDGTLSVDPPPPPFVFQRPLQVDDSEENVSEFEV